MVKSLLIRLSKIHPLRRAVRAGRRGARTWLLWPLTASRKSRLAQFDTTGEAAPPLVHVDLGRGCGCPHAAQLVGLTEDALRPLTASPIGGRFRPTPLAIALHRFADFTAWRKTVSRNTDGKYHRSANKARRMGYETRVVGLKSYERSFQALKGSKWRRSKGVFVWAALLGAREDLVDTGAPPQPPRCSTHWRRCWGVFRVDETGEHLAAFALLVRSGNVVWVQSLIGHGAALTDGVTKMLMFDIMTWLLARDEPATRGIDHLLHGYVEEGSVGLFDWKRYLAYTPVDLRL